jgi:hypothetical protein
MIPRHCEICISGVGLIRAMRPGRAVEGEVNVACSCRIDSSASTERRICCLLRMFDPLCI